MNKDAAIDTETLIARLNEATAVANVCLESMGIINHAMGYPFRNEPGKTVRELAVLAADRLRSTLQPAPEAPVDPAPAARVLPFRHSPAACSYCLQRQAEATR
jgi:hypothetical protein